MFRRIHRLSGAAIFVFLSICLLYFLNLMRRGNTVSRTQETTDVRSITVCYTVHIPMVHSYLSRIIFRSNVGDYIGDLWSDI